jgi:hypothetical protein
VIDNPGVYHEVAFSFGRMILCKWFGLHAWRYWRMAASFEAAFPLNRDVERTCARCGIMQCAAQSKSEKQKWLGRI